MLWGKYGCPAQVSSSTFLVKYNITLCSTLNCLYWQGEGKCWTFCLHITYLVYIARARKRCWLGGDHHNEHVVPLSSVPLKFASSFHALAIQNSTDIEWEVVFTQAVSFSSALICPIQVHSWLGRIRSIHHCSCHQLGMQNWNKAFTEAVGCKQRYCNMVRMVSHPLCWAKGRDEK